MIKIELNKPIRVSVDLIDTLTKWIPASTFVLSYVLTCILVASTCRNDPTSKLSRFRNKLALFFSADVFYKVMQNPEEIPLLEPQTINDTEVLTNLPRIEKHACYTQDFVIKSSLGKNTFYSLYILSLPLQIVMVCLIILERIFVQQISMDSCASYILSARDDSYYYCRLMSETFSPESTSKATINKFCNSTINNDTYSEKIDDIICMQYYFDKTKIIEIVTNIFVWQKLSATVSVYLIRYFQYLFRHCSLYVKNVPCGSFCMFFMIIFVNGGFILTALVLYLILGNQSTISTFTLDLISVATITLISIFVSMNSFAWIIRDYSKHQPCLFHVTLAT
jgi:hypothetical protein